jgi:hypothetical protein
MAAAKRGHSGSTQVAWLGYSRRAYMKIDEIVAGNIDPLIIAQPLALGNVPSRNSRAAEARFNDNNVGTGRDEVEWDATSVVSMGATGSGKVKDQRPSRRVHGRQGLRQQGVLSACPFRACKNWLRATIFYDRSHSMSEPFTELRFTGCFGVHGKTVLLLEASLVVVQRPSAA